MSYVPTVVVATAADIKEEEGAPGACASSVASVCSTSKSSAPQTGPQRAVCGLIL